MATYEVSLNSEQLSGLLPRDQGLQGLVKKEAIRLGPCRLRAVSRAKRIATARGHAPWRAASVPWCGMCRRCATAVAARNALRVLNAMRKPWGWR